MPREFTEDVRENRSWRKNEKQLATGRKNNAGDLMNLFLSVQSLGTEVLKKIGGGLFGLGQQNPGRHL